MNAKPMKKILFMLLMLLTFQAAQAADLVVENAWVRLSPPVAQSTAAYVVIRNTGSENVKMIAVSCDVAASVSLHSMHMNGKRMVMSQIPEMEIPANGEVQLTPGGSHVMLMGLKYPLKEGQMVEIVFHLSNGEALTVMAPVRDMRASHGHHNSMH